MSIATLSLALFAPAKTGGAGYRLSTSTLVLIGIVVVVGLIAIIAWREGGRRAQKDAREAERNREVD